MTPIEEKNRVSCKFCGSTFVAVTGTRVRDHFLGAGHLRLEDPDLNEDDEDGGGQEAEAETMPSEDDIEVDLLDK